MYPPNSNYKIDCGLGGIRLGNGSTGFTTPQIALSLSTYYPHVISTRHDAGPTYPGYGNAIDFNVWTPCNISGTLVNASSNSSNTIMSITSCNVGIGTTQPNWNYKLDVNGTSRVGGMLIGSNMCGYGNNFIGMRHMAMSNTSDSYCILQDNNGVTYLNSAAGADLYMRVRTATVIIG